MKRLPTITSFLLFIMLCASLAYWSMQWFRPPVRAIAAPPAVAQAEADLDAAATLLGGGATSAAASNFQLKGVVVAGNPAESVAILAVDGKPQSVRAGTEIKPGVTIKEVQREYVLLSEGGAIRRVELPEGARKK